MVSKVAVIAIVGILAVPIIMGYAFNFEEVQETEWKLSGEAVDVTSLLMNDVEYSTALADIYQLNTNTNMGGIKSLPLYENRTKTSSSLYSRLYSNVATEGVDYDLTELDNWGLNIHNSSDSQYLRMKIYLTINNNLVNYDNVNNVINASYDDLSKTLNYSYILTDGYSGVRTGTYTNDHIVLRFEHVNGFIPNNDGVMWGSPKSDDKSNFNGYVDFSAGFRILKHAQTVNYPYVWTQYPPGSIIFPQNTKTAIVTVDLDSITFANHSILVGDPWFYLNKTTTNGVVSWQIVDYYDPSKIIDLYYNQSGGNTYQLYFYVDPNGEPTGTPGYYEYTQHIQFRYVGNWPDLIGEADYYLTYDYSRKATLGKYPGFSGISFESHTSPIMRVDAAEYLAFQYSVINDQTYDPAAFKNNPSTTITDPKTYGSSITFGNVTYKVTKGNIRIGTHDIPVKDLVLSSIPNQNGGFDNKIGNTVISTTAYPSTITFNGKWLVTITTATQDSEQITRTEWKAGEFAWNGIDHNFIMVGLLASVGAFIALGIYARRTKSSVWPLLIVCGCSALVFFALL